MRIVHKFDVDLTVNLDHEQNLGIFKARGYKAGIILLLYLRDL